jgi:hypothetical protein
MLAAAALWAAGEEEERYGRWGGAPSLRRRDTETQSAREEGEKGEEERDDQILKARHGWARGPFIPHMQSRHVQSGKKKKPCLLRDRRTGVG